MKETNLNNVHIVSQLYLLACLLVCVPPGPPAIWSCTNEVRTRPAWKRMQPNYQIFSRSRKLLGKEVRNLIAAFEATQNPAVNLEKTSSRKCDLSKTASMWKINEKLKMH